MPMTGRPSNWSCGMPWFFIQDRWTSPSRSWRPNQATDLSLRLFLVMICFGARGTDGDRRAQRMTSSARTRSACGIFSPSAFAALTLITITPPLDDPVQRILSRRSRDDTLPALHVEHVDHRGIDAQRDPVAGIDHRPSVRHQHELGLSRLDQELRLRPRRLHDHDLARDGTGRIAACQLQVLRPDPVRHSLTVRARGVAQGPAHPTRGFHMRSAAVPAYRPLDYVHRRRTDELRHEQVPRPVIELQRRADL